MVCSAIPISRSYTTTSRTRSPGSVSTKYPNHSLSDRRGPAIFFLSSGSLIYHRQGLPLLITVNHQGGPPPLGGGRNWVHFPGHFRSALHTYLSYQIYLLYVLGHLRHPRGKPFDADPVRLCQTLARKGTAEIRFEAVSGRSEANVPARLGPLQIVAACRLAWRSG